MNPQATAPGTRIPGSLGSADNRRVAWADWWPVGLGLLVLYVPTYVRLTRDFWVQEEYAHGPIILAMVLWLAWRARDALIGDTATLHPTIGGSLLLIGLLSYVLGRSQYIPLLEVGSQVPVLAGSLLLVRGLAALHRLWFPIFFLVFLVPLPGIIIDPLTGELKHLVSAIAETLLYTAGYPIARSGIVLSIGPYQLLVADACSGLHSLFSTAALGLLYIYLTDNGSMLRNGALVASLLPIAFVANVIRVLALVLVTFHFGEQAGQGFIHGFSGILLFVVGLLALMALDSLLGVLVVKPRTAR